MLIEATSPGIASTAVYFHVTAINVESLAGFGGVEFLVNLLPCAVLAPTIVVMVYSVPRGFWSVDHAPPTPMLENQQNLVDHMFNRYWLSATLCFRFNLGVLGIMLL